MKVLVLGGAGMLGHKLSQVLAATHEVWATTTDNGDDLLSVSDLPRDRMLTNFNALSGTDLCRAFEVVRPHIAINAIGIVKQSHLMSNAELTIAINASLPHKLQRLALQHDGVLIHLSTDCVFSGTTGMYTEQDLPDAVDLYGRSKLLGETGLDSSLTLRTSMIGAEIRHRLGLLEWLFAHPAGEVPGFNKAYFSGLPTVVLARAIGRLIDDGLTQRGCFHVASERISKFELLKLVTAATNGDWTVVPSPRLAVDRSLNGEQFKAATGLTFPSWPELVEQMVLDMHAKVSKGR